MSGLIEAMHSNYLGKYDEAIQACDKAIKMNPQNTDARTAKGTSLFGQSKYDEAIKAYDEAIRLDSKFTKAWYNKGVTLLSQKSMTKLSSASMRLKGWILTMQKPGTTKALP